MYDYTPTRDCFMTVLELSYNIGTIAIIYAIVFISRKGCWGKEMPVFSKVKLGYSANPVSLTNILLGGHLC